MVCVSVRWRHSHEPQLSGFCCNDRLVDRLEISLLEEKRQTWGFKWYVFYADRFIINMSFDFASIARKPHRAGLLRTKADIWQSNHTEAACIVLSQLRVAADFARGFVRFLSFYWLSLDSCMVTLFNDFYKYIFCTSLGEQTIRDSSIQISPRPGEKKDKFEKNLRKLW